MRKEFLDRGFVHIKNNKPLSNIDLKNIVDEFGDMYVYPDKYNFVVDNSFSIIRKDKLLGDSKLEWHKDMIHTSPWYAGTLLYCEEPSDMPTDFCYTMNSSLIDKVYKHGCFSGATLVGNKEYKNEISIKGSSSELFSEKIFSKKPNYLPYFRIKDQNGTFSRIDSEKANHFELMFDSFFSSTRDVNDLNNQSAAFLNLSHFLDQIINL